MKSKKETALEREILARLNGKPLEMAKIIFTDDEIRHLMDYANIVSIKRLGFNDHGPVHMKTASLNALIMFDLLSQAGVLFNLVSEGVGTIEESKIAVLTASMLHDIGMTVGRENHEIYSIVFASSIVERLLLKIYPDEFEKRVILRSLILEGIAGHMATQKIHSLEAGLVLIGDGCDMEKGRARIPSLLSTKPKVGDIHRYSSSAILHVRIMKGTKKPIRIDIEMRESVGFFQIEEVLFPKILSSPVRPYIELFAGVTNQESMQYL